MTSIETDFPFPDLPEIKGPPTVRTRDELTTFVRGFWVGPSTRELLMLPSAADGRPAGPLGMWDCPGPPWVEGVRSVLEQGRDLVDATGPGGRLGFALLRGGGEPTAGEEDLLWASTIRDLGEAVEVQILGLDLVLEDKVVLTLL